MIPAGREVFRQSVLANGNEWKTGIKNFNEKMRDVRSQCEMIRNQAYHFQRFENREEKEAFDYDFRARCFTVVPREDRHANLMALDIDGAQEDFIDHQLQLLVQTVSGKEEPDVLAYLMSRSKGRGPYKYYWLFAKISQDIPLKTADEKAASKELKFSKQIAKEKENIQEICKKYDLNKLLADLQRITRFNSPRVAERIEKMKQFIAGLQEGQAKFSLIDRDVLLKERYGDDVLSQELINFQADIEEVFTGLKAREAEKQKLANLTIVLR